jgi:hypothetical protein
VRSAWLDVFYLAAIVAFFAAIVGGVGLCRRVVGSGDYETLDRADMTVIEDDGHSVGTGHTPR